MRLVPARNHVFVNAFPRDEGNAVEAVRALIERYRGRIIWADAPEPERLRDLGLDPSRIRRVGKRSPLGILAFLQARAVFNTHGIYGCPKPVPGKAMVNLWHGDGPKGHAGAIVYSTYLVTGSAVFGRRLAADFHVSNRDLLLTGLPRTRQLRTPADAETLTRLGVDPTRPFVVWMPTVRQYSAAGVNDARSDTTDLAADLDLAARVAPGARALAAMGVQVVVKPHPIDLVSRRFDGFPSVSDPELIAAGTTAYAFLGASAGLLTDYSSVWTDYLAVDRPIAFFTPDLEAYLRGRGVVPGSFDHLPGPTLTTLDDFEAFGREVLGETVGEGRTMRQRAREHFQIIHPENPADDLLDELERRRALDLRRAPVEARGASS